MTVTTEEQNETTAAARPQGGRERTLLLVAGPGRSGTSLFTGILQRLGFYVPQPEVPANETNPRGFAESQWVVEFHSSLLKTANVQVADARPAAWARTAEISLRPSVEKELTRWLAQQFRQADDLVIKDPRLSWFLSLWRRCAERAGASPRFATVLRHPAAVIDSKERWYGPWQGGVSRAAGWVNQMLFTERGTRDTPRAFVRYDDLLDDWMREIGRLGTILDLRVIRDAPVPAMRSAHDFVDKSLSRSQSKWEDMRIPASLRAQIDSVWELASQLVDSQGVAAPDVIEQLEAARAAYVELYQEAEAIAQSSIVKARRRAAAAADGRVSPRVASLLGRVPARYRHKVPPRWRRAVVRALHRDAVHSR
jgi:hypothetical protein